MQRTRPVVRADVGQARPTGADPFENLAVARISEPVRHGRGDGRADTVDHSQGLGGCGGDSVHRAHLTRQRARRARPDMADGQADQQPPQRSDPSLLHPTQNLVDLLLAEPAQSFERLGAQVEDVAHVVHAAGIEQGDRGLITEPVDVQRAPGGEMEDRLS